MGLEDILLHHEQIPTFARTAVAISSATLILYMGYRWFSRTSKVDCPPNTVLLHQFKPGPHAPSGSPFCLKLETYLRLAGISYQNDFKNPMSKKGKAPWITFNNEDLADSQFIIEYLNKKFDVDLNENLNNEQKAVAKAIQVMVDEHLLWPLAYFRWIYGQQSDLTRYLAPWYARSYVFRLVNNNLYSQGIGRHSTEEIKSILLKDVLALHDYLGDKPFMMGPELTEVDCSVFGMLSQFIWHSEDDVCMGLIQEQFPRLHQYCLRIKERVWPDWEEASKVIG